jgi:hypothetical protein
MAKLSKIDDVIKWLHSDIKTIELGTGSNLLNTFISLLLVGFLNPIYLTQEINITCNVPTEVETNKKCISISPLYGGQSRQ